MKPDDKNFAYPEFIARFYDVIYHQVRDSVDHDFFVNEALQCRSRVLEIGSGTGRLFTEALSQGADIYGIDVSQSMIDVLKTKIDASAHFRVSRQNIADFSFAEPFGLALAPFRVVMHLGDKQTQLQALNNVCRHLDPGGRFIFDAFVPGLEQLLHGFDNFMDFEGEYEPGKKVRRFVSTKPELMSQTIHVTFRIEWDEAGGIQSREWEFGMRYFFRYELEHLLERSDFGSYRIYGDYRRGALNETSKDFVVECFK